MNIKEISQLQGGEPIPQFTGTIVSIYPKKGPDNYGKFKQDVKVRDATGECYMVFAGNNQIDESARGCEITVNCSQGKSSLQGVKAKLNEYNGKRDIRIWVTDTARVNIGSPPANNGRAESHQPPKQEAPLQSSSGRSSTVLLTKEFVTAHAEAWVHTYEATKDIFARVLSEDQIPERITSIMISAGYGQHFQFSAGPPPPDESWKEFVFNKSKGLTLGSLEPEKLLKICSALLTKTPNHPEASNAIKYLMESDAREDKFEVAGDIIFWALSPSNPSLTKDHIDNYIESGEFNSSTSVVIDLLSSPDPLGVIMSAIGLPADDNDAIEID